METSNIYRDLESNVRWYCRFLSEELSTARNAVINTSSGKSYIDFLSGCGSLNYGHNNPALKDDLVRYILDDGIAHGLDFHSCAKRKLIEAFHDRILTPRNLNYKIQFTGPTGANAVEAALKLARKATGRSNIIAFTNGFHGVSLGALSVTGNRANRAASGVELGNVTRAPYDGYFGRQFDTIQWVEQLLSDPSSGVDAPAAFIVETVQGEGGINVASSEWLRSLRHLASRHGALLIVDEVQVGCGRTGTFFSFEHAQIAPDIVVLAKSLSGFGLPLAAVLIAPEYDVWQPGEHSGTFRGNNHAFVTAAAAIHTFWTSFDFTGAIDRKSRTITEVLLQLEARLGWKAKGRGLIQGMTAPSAGEAQRLRDRCVAAGILVELCGPSDETIKLMPPLTIEDEILEEGLAKFSAAALASGQDAAA